MPLAHHDHDSIREYSVEAVGGGLPVAWFDALRPVDQQAAVWLDGQEVIACLGGTLRPTSIADLALSGELQQAGAVV